MNQAIIFCTGVAVGGLVGYYIGKKREERFREEEIESVKAAYSKDIHDAVNEAYDEYKKQAEKLCVSYIPTDEEKSGDDEWDEAEKENPVEPEMVPYVISPDAFANEKSEYAKLTLVYYEDNEVLINEEEECVYIDTSIGYDAINHFGEYEKDAVFVRNEALGNDYEVLLEHSSWPID